jgi:molecular chaperone GrpE
LTIDLENLKSDCQEILTNLIKPEVNVPSKDKPGSTASLNQKLNPYQVDALVDEFKDEKDSEPREYLSYNQLQEKLTEADEKASQSYERMLRVQAEMDNLQRRTERDIANAHKYALEKFVLELLPIVDGLERALMAHADETSGGGDSLLDGVSMTLNMIYAAFKKFGIEQVNPEEQSFNPELHQAVSTQTDPNVKSGTVISVLQKGYLLNNRLIRPALVVVAKN